MRYGLLADHEAIPGFVNKATGPVLAAFTTRFAAKTLARRVKRRDLAMSDDEMAAIDAFAEDANDMKANADARSRRSTLDPVRQLIASAFGVALGGVGEVLEGRLAGKLLVREGGLTIYAALGRLEADAAAHEKLFTAAWSKSIGVAARLLPKTITTLIGLFEPVAMKLFLSARSGDAKKTSLRLRSDFRRRIELLERDGRLGRENTLVSVFSDAMDGG